MKNKWEYGTCNGRNARRNKKTGAVQFVLWEAGEAGHTVDYWHNFDSSWWSSFIKEKQMKLPWYWKTKKLSDTHFIMEIQPRRIYLWWLIAKQLFKRLTHV